MSEAQILHALDSFMLSKHDDKDTGYEGKRVVLEAREDGRMPEDGLALRQIESIRLKYPALMAEILAALPKESSPEASPKPRLKIQLAPDDDVTQPQFGDTAMIA